MCIVKVIIVSDNLDLTHGNITKINELIKEKRFFGEPSELVKPRLLSGSLKDFICVDMSKISHRVDRIYIEDYVYADIEILDTLNGKLIKKFYDYGMQLKLHPRKMSNQVITFDIKVEEEIKNA